MTQTRENTWIRSSLWLVLLCGCGGGEETTDSATTTTQPVTTQSTTDATSDGTQTGETSGEPGTASESETADPTDTETEATTEGPTTTEGETTDDTSETEATTDEGCGACDEPNEICIDNECVNTCHNQVPDPCGPDQVCDVVTGECQDPETPCVVSGDTTACGDQTCGPGTVCDGQGACMAIAPCYQVECTSDGSCWGDVCACERIHECMIEPDLEQLNGPFSTEIGDLEFADDCTAWMVTLRSGTDYVRRLETDSTLTEWAGVSNLNMGEVKVLKALSIPGQAQTPGHETNPETPTEIEGLGEVAITYTCCATCGCFVDPPQGVARLNEDDMQNPLPIVIVAEVTGGDGPFGDAGADAGPMGLTWGEDRVLYVGNSTQNGDLNSADLDAQSQDVLTPLPERVHAAAAISPVHLLVAIEGGSLYRYNIATQELEFVIDVGSDVTSLSHDAFSGLVYAGLQSLEIITIRPFTGEIESFDTMPGVGRVTVSPNGELYYCPVKYLANLPISKWDLPDMQ